MVSKFTRAIQTLIFKKGGICKLELNISGVNFIGFNPDPFFSDFEGRIPCQYNLIKVLYSVSSKAEIKKFNHRAKKCESCLLCLSLLLLQAWVHFMFSVSAICNHDT